MITQDLGIATAYGYAKSKGYTGTEAEFAELMASYASTAQTAIEAANRAVEANTAAQSAKTDAAASKTAAQTAAQTATTKASEASQSASTATTKASEASQSASTASAAATSAGTSAQTATTAASTATTKASEAAASEAAALSAKTDAETARDAAAQSASEAAASAESIDPDEFDRKIYAAFVTDTASGSIASFADGADNIPMKDVLVHIEPVQEGSGDPSPDNIRPITGWTAAKVTRTGKNLWNPKLYGGGTYNPTIGAVFNLSESAMQFAQDGDTFSLVTSKAWEYYTLLFDIADTSLPYYRHFTFTTDDTGGVTEAYLDKDFAVIWKKNSTDKTQIIDGAFSIPTDAKYYAVVITNRGTEETTLSIKAPQIELGSTATDYEPYSGQTYDITFPSEAGTVYGGTLDVTKGELVVDRVMLDLGTLNWTKHATLANAFQAFRPVTSPAWAVIPNGGVADAICDIYKLTTSAAGGVGAIDMSIALGTGTSITMYVHDSRFTDVSDFISSVSGSKIVYHLAAPITHQLTPQEITSLLGTNNLWADTGDSEVEYRADTTLYIGRLTEPDADMIADSNITSGQYFMVGNNLYRATSNIASGASVIVGTNAVKVSLATALNEINQ